MPANLAQSFGFTGIHEAVSTQRAGLFFFGRRTGEGRHLGAEGTRKLNGKVAEAADSHDSHP